MGFVNENIENDVKKGKKNASYYWEFFPLLPLLLKVSMSCFHLNAGLFGKGL